MNWSAVSFDWNQVRAFLATVEEGSLSAAARALRLTQPTLGRQVAALEAHLGVELFARTGRSLTLTAAGQELLDHVRSMADAAARISLTASGQSQSIEGHVVITASDAISAYLLPDILKELRATAPGITVEVVASNTIRDLQRREADIAVRHVRAEQPELIARLVRTSRAHLYASTDWVAQHGLPSGPAALNDAAFIGFDDNARLISELNACGLALSARNFVLNSGSGVAMWEMVRHGLGVGVMMRDVADATGGVVRILPEISPGDVPIWLTVHREVRTSRRIRLVYDLLAEALS